MGVPSTQLPREHQDSTEDPLSIRRPVLFHVNADTTWLLSLPYPDDARCPSQRCRFNLLIDPWLQGPQTDVASWFSTQWHKVRSSVQTIGELNGGLRCREEVELDALGRSNRRGSQGSSTSNTRPSNYIDAIVCSHEFTDHCHRKTLEEVDPSVPCFAPSKAAELIRSWNHFDEVFVVSPLDRTSDWRRSSASALPPWIGIARLVTESDALYFHAAIAIFCKDTRAAHADSAEAIIYTPHGIHPEGLAALSTADPPIRTLALMHGLHDVSISFTKQLNLGAHNALRCQTILKAKYWVGTHDEVKASVGIIARFLRRKVYTLQDALEAQEKDKKAANLPADEINYIELASGNTMLLS